MRTPTTSKSNPRRSERRAGRQPARRVAVSSEQRVRDAGGPQDTAFYRCACGFGFEGDVSTYVACPHCGTDQEW